MSLKICDYQQMAVVQASSFTALFCWYPDYAKKLDQQIQSVKTGNLSPIDKLQINPWKGICRQMVIQPAFPFIFGCKDRILKYLTPEERASATFAQVLLASSIAGALTGPYCNAGEVYILRRRSNPNENWHQALKQVSKESGILAFFKGASAMTVRNAKLGAILAGANPLLLTHLDQSLPLTNPTKTLSICKTATVIMLSGTISALVASLLTMPTDNIAVRRQTNALGLDKSLSTTEAIKKIYQESGWRGFFVGTRFRCKQATKEFIGFNLAFSAYSYLMQTHLCKKN